MNNVDILVPIDFSDLSYKALEAATTIAGMFDGTITPFHSFVSINEAGEPDADISKQYADAHEKLEQKLIRELDEVASKWVSPRYLNSGVVKMGNPSKTIIEAAQDYDLIVMTTHGRTGFSRLILGSVTVKVIRFAPVPVLVVEEASQIKPFKKILLTTDFSDYSMKAIPYAKDFAKASEAVLDIIHIISFDQFGSIPQIQSATDTRKKQMIKLVDEHFSDMKDQVNTEIVSTKKSIHEKITKLAHKNGYNLIVMATIGRTGLEYLRLGSTASNVVRHVENAVLTINPRRMSDVSDYKME